MTAIETLVKIAHNFKLSPTGRPQQLTKTEMMNIARDYCIENSIPFTDERILQ